MSLFLSPQRLRHVPVNYRSHPLYVRFSLPPYEGMTPPVVPDIDPEEPEGYAVSWNLNHELELDSIPAQDETELMFEIWSDKLNRIVGFGELIVNLNNNNGEFQEIVKIMDNRCEFAGSKLHVALVQISKPAHIPKYICIRINRGVHFLLSSLKPVDDDTTVYLQVYDQDRLMGTTSKVRGTKLEWNESFEGDYSGSSSVEIRGFGVNKHGDRLDFGSARINIWDLLKSPPSKEGQWIKHGSVLLAPEGRFIKESQGEVLVSMRFWDDRLAVPIHGLADEVVSDKPVENTPHEQASPAGRADAAPALLGAAKTGTPTEDIPQTPAELRSFLEDAKRLAAEAGQDARAAEAAAADADSVARANPRHDIDELANDAEAAAQKSQVDASEASALAKRVEDEVARRHPRVDLIEETMKKLREKAHDTGSGRGRAEDDSRNAMQLACDELAARAKEHYNKTADYATQTCKLADEFDQVPRIRQLADGTKECSASAMRAAKEARAAAKYAKDVQSLDEARAVLQDCEALVKNAKDAENEAHHLWQKANALAQKHLKKLDSQRQAEWQRIQAEAEAEAERKRDERRRDHEQDRAQRLSGRRSDVEADAYNAAATYLSTSSLSPPRTSQGGIFHRLCMDQPRENPRVHTPNKAASRICGGTDASTTAEDGESDAGSDRAHRRSGSKNYHGEPLLEYGIQETLLARGGRRTPWCWCFGCQCCHCCGEC